MENMMLVTFDCVKSSPEQDTQRERKHFALIDNQELRDILDWLIEQEEEFYTTDRGLSHISRYVSGQLAVCSGSDEAMIKLKLKVSQFYPVTSYTHDGWSYDLSTRREIKNGLLLSER